MGFVIVGGIAVTIMVVGGALKVGFRTLRRYIRPKVRGNSGEKKVDKCLRKFKGRGFERVKDALLPYRKNTSQIDNILISQHGIFVIETKNYAGTIKGKENAQQWEQIFPKSANVKPRKFYNPIMQNEGHIKALQSLIYHSYKDFPHSKLNKIPFHNVVVFSDNNRFPRIPGVVSLNNLQSFLKNEMLGPPVLSEEDVKLLKNIIEKNNIKDISKRSEHVMHAKDIAVKVQNQQKREELHERAVANKDVAFDVQSFWDLAPVFAKSRDNPSSLDEKISEAQREGINQDSSDTKEKDFEPER